MSNFGKDERWEAGIGVGVRMGSLGGRGGGGVQENRYSGVKTV